MDVKFITTLRELVDTVPIVDGQVLITKDYNNLFYDMHQTRYRVGSPMWLNLEDDDLSAGFAITDGTVGVIELVPNEGSDLQLQEGTQSNFVVGKVGDPVGLTRIPEPTREGYKFLGWFTDKNFTSSKVETFPSKFSSGKITYYASWIKM